MEYKDGGSLSPPEVEVHPPRQLAWNDPLRINSLIWQGMILPGLTPPRVRGQEMSSHLSLDRRPSSNSSRPPNRPLPMRATQAGIMAR